MRCILIPIILYILGYVIYNIIINYGYDKKKYNRIIYRSKVEDKSMFDELEQYYNKEYYNRKGINIYIDDL